jgi:hypothetical protein
MRISRFVASGAVALALTGGVLGGSALPAGAGPDDLGGADAPIRPGVQTVTEAGQCTANFVFTNGTDVFLGQAAHCSGQGAATATDGCDQEADPLPIGSPVEIVGFDGVSYDGTLAYSSWNTMIANGETDANTCAYNDFALVRIDPADHGATNSSLPYWGGPQGSRSGSTALGDAVYTYGNSGLRGGISTLSPKSGTAISTEASGWNHTIYTATPGIPGDSGSAVLDENGAALGILVTVAIAPLAGSNGVTDVDKALAYANAHGGIGSLALINGTDPFDANTLVPGLPGLPIGK